MHWSDYFTVKKTRERSAILFVMMVHIRLRCIMGCVAVQFRIPRSFWETAGFSTSRHKFCTGSRLTLYSKSAKHVKYRVFSRDVTKFKIFPRKLPPPCWCPFAAFKVSWIYGHLHYKRCLRRKMTLPNCLNMQIHLILLLRKGTCRK